LNKNTMNLNSIKNISRALKSKDISVQELNDLYLNKLNTHAADLNCVITHTTDLSAEQIQQAQNQIDSGQAPVLTGVPLIHKDLFCTKNIN